MLSGPTTRARGHRERGGGVASPSPRIALASRSVLGTLVVGGRRFPLVPEVVRATDGVEEEQALGAASPGAPGPKLGNRSDCVRMTNLIEKLNQTTSPVSLPLVTGLR